MVAAHDEGERTAVIHGMTTLADGVVGLVLRPADGADWPAWQPGAHIDLCLGDDLVRQYSLCGDPARRDEWRVAVLRAPESRGGSIVVHEKLAEGDTLTVRGPRNNFPLRLAPRYVFVAGGIGITPILPMLAAAEEAGADWTLDYGGRSRASMAFVTELRERYGTGVRIHPQDEVGLPDLDAIMGVPRPATLVYCCGPEPLLRAVEEKAAAWQQGCLQVERFAPKGPIRTADDGQFEVRLASAGVTLEIRPGQSILDAVEDAGIDWPYACREGTCGTCETPVLEGTADHRDSILSEEERATATTMFICVSRSACSRLVLEI
jgi:ferredoxin-NADP reductase